MNVEWFFSRTWIVIAAGFIGAINVLAVWVAYIGISHWQKELKNFVRVNPKVPAPSLDTSIWISAGVVTILDVIHFAGMNVGQFLDIVLNNPEGLAWLCSSVLMPLIFGKAVTKFTSGKYGSLETPPNTTTTTTASTTSTTGVTP